MFADAIAPVDELVDALKAASIRAGVDLAGIQAPGVWVQPLGPGLDTLGGTAVRVRLVLVVPDNGIGRAYAAIAALADQVNAVIPIRAYDYRTVLMPDGNQLPGAETQIALRATTE